MFLLEEHLKDVTAAAQLDLQYKYTATPLDHISFAMQMLLYKNLFVNESKSIQILMYSVLTVII